MVVLDTLYQEIVREAGTVLNKEQKYLNEVNCCNQIYDDLKKSISKHDAKKLDKLLLNSKRKAKREGSYLFAKGFVMGLSHNEELL